MPLEAVAAALAKGLGLEPSCFFPKYIPIPNEHVYQLVVSARTWATPRER